VRLEQPARSGILAPFVCLAFAAGYAIEGGVGDGRVRRALGGTAAAFAATLLTPNGPALWAYALRSIGDANHSHRAIAEWLPLFDGDVLKPAIIWLLVVAALLRSTAPRPCGCSWHGDDSLTIFETCRPARAQWTVQPRGGEPQPNCARTPSTTIAGTVGSPPVSANIAARCARSFCAS
jgi:hypothetical protein